MWSILLTLHTREELFDEILNEREEVAIRRKHCSDLIAALKQALSVLD